MKKAYKKPDILFENFALSSNIAGSCAGVSDLHSSENGCYQEALYSNKNSCAFDDGGYIWYMESATGCAYVPQDKDDDNLCYHVPEGEPTLFSS